MHLWITHWVYFPCLRLQGDNDGERPLLEWLCSAVQDPEVPDLASSWNNGVNLSALVDYCQPGLIPDHASLDPEQRRENVQRAMELAEEHLQIPQLMHPEDLAVDKPDKLSTMTYLSQFCCPNSVGERTLLEFVRKKLPKQNITNFTTDWVDGRVLGALTATVCVFDTQTTQSNPTERCSEAMTAAQVHLFARKILETSEFINPELDPRLRMAYLTELQQASTPPRILDTHIPEISGAEQEIVVDLEVPEHGKIEASAKGALTGLAGVKVESVGGGRSLVKIPTMARDQYTVTITHSGRVIRGCPFVVSLDSYSVPHAETNMPKKIGDACRLTFDTSQVDGKPLEVKVSGKASGEVVHTLQDSSPGLSIISFVPQYLDTYTVTLAVGGKAVKESPFVVPILHMADPDKVMCGGIASAGIDSPVSLTVDCSNAGKGVLTASCIGQQSGDVPVNINTTSDTSSTVSFTPGSADLYLLQVMYEGMQVPGSPWCIDFRNLPPMPGKVKVVDKPTGTFQVSKLLAVEFDAVNGGSGQLTATCSGATCGDVPVSIVTTGLGIFRVGFVPMVPDNYFVTVYWAGTPVQGSPFQISLGCQPVNSSKCRIVGLVGNPALVKMKTGYHALTGHQMVLQVKTDGAGEAKLEAKLRTPSKEISLISKPSPDDPKTRIISYAPIYNGHHCMQLLWGGSPIPGSPIKFSTVSPLVFPVGGPISVELELDGKKKDLNGEAVLQKEGLPEKTRATVESATNKKVVLSLDSSEMEPGTYVLSVYSKYKELPGSPLVLVYGSKETDTGKKEVDTVAVSDTDGASNPADPISSSVSVVQERVTEEAKMAVVIDSAALESSPPPPPPPSEPSEGKEPEVSLTALEVSPTSRERSYTTDTPINRDNAMNVNQRSNSVGKRPEVPKTTTPIGTQTTFVMPEHGKPSPVEQNHPHSDLELVPESQSSLAEPGAASLPQKSATLPPLQEHSKETADEPERRLSDVAATHQKVEGSEKNEEGEKGKKGKKVKEEKATKVKREKDKAKKDKKEKKKQEGGLNLEDQEFRVGVKMKYKLHCEALGSKPPATSCRPPDAVKTAIIPAPEFGKNTYWCELTPTKVGDLEVSIIYENFHILGSPFSVSVGPRGDASQCTMVETSSTCRQQLENSLLFCIEVPQTARKGKLTASVRSAITSKRLSGVRTLGVTDQHYHVEFVPSEGLEYILSVKYDERHIKGSPFVINLGDPAKCKVHGNGIKLAQINEENTFEINGSEAGPGELSVTVEREGKPVETKTTVIGDNQYRISYTAHKMGVYRVSVKWGDGHVQHSPFDVPCISPSQFHIPDGSLHRVYAGAASSFQVAAQATHVRQKQLSIFAHPKSDITKMFSGEIVQASEGVFTCSLRPTEDHVGLCNMHICWNGRDIQGSPYEIDIVNSPHPSEFSLEAVETESGDIAVDVIGPVDVFATESVDATAENIFTGEQVAARVTKVNNERIRIQLLPTAGGEYQLSILYTGNHIASSPFVLTQADPSQCQVLGEGIRVSRVNELTKFKVDHSKAGLGHLKIEIEGEGGKTIEPFIASGEALSEVSYISRELGVYRLLASWGEHRFPDSPFIMYTVDPSKFSIKSSVPKKLPVNQSLKFTVAAGAPVAEWERLSVTAKLIHKQQIYRGKVEAEKSRREHSFHCSVDIPQEGYYAVYMQCRGLDIQGSPFKIRMMPAPRPEKVVVSGPGLKGGVMGEKQTFSIDAREGGYGNIQLKVQGEKGGLSIDMHRHESSKHIIVAEYTPEYPGKYTIHVFWAGLAVADSPYSVSVRNSKNGEAPKNRASDTWVSSKHYQLQ